LSADYLVLASLSWGGTWKGIRWVELDCCLKDMVDELAIRPEWDNFLAGNPSRLIERFAGDIVLTVPSRLIINASNYSGSDTTNTGTPEWSCLDISVTLADDHILFFRGGEGR
jgi:hypothetical protein